MSLSTEKQPQDVWKDIWDHNRVDIIWNDLREVMTLCDRQCYGMVRPELTADIKTRLARVKGKIDQLIRMLPP